MNSNVEKNPFSIYDFLGYLFPGALFLFFICRISSDDLHNISVEMFISTNLFENISFIGIVFFIISSYVLGHIISYTSSLTVERFSLWCYGYPSEFLLAQRRGSGFWSSFIATSGTKLTSLLKDEPEDIGRIIITHTLLKVLLSFILFPISIFAFLCHIIKFDNFITRPLDNYLKVAINLKLIALLKKIGLPQAKSNVECDFLKIIGTKM